MVSLHFIPLGLRVFELQPISVEDMMRILPFSLVAITGIEIQKLLRRLLDGRKAVR